MKYLFPWCIIFSVFVKKMIELLLKNVVNGVSALHLAIFDFQTITPEMNRCLILWVEFENVNKNHHYAVEYIELTAVSCKSFWADNELKVGFVSGQTVLDVLFGHWLGVYQCQLRLDFNGTSLFDLGVCDSRWVPKLATLVIIIDMSIFLVRLLKNSRKHGRNNFRIGRKCSAMLEPDFIFLFNMESIELFLVIEYRSHPPNNIGIGPNILLRLLNNWLDDVLNLNEGSCGDLRVLGLVLFGLGHGPFVLVLEGGLVYIFSVIDELFYWEFGTVRLLLFEYLRNTW